MFKWLNKLFNKEPKGKRLFIRLVTYSDAEVLLSKGWQIAKQEEDCNQEIGMVYLELIEKNIKK